MATDDNYNIAERYTKALFALADKGKQLDALEADLQALAGLWAESRDLRNFAANPLISRAEKAKAVKALLTKGKASALTVKFLQRLAFNNRLTALPLAITLFQKQLAAHRNELTLDVTSARPLSEKQEQAVGAALAKSYGRTIRMQTHVDPSLLGGLVIRIGGTMIDYSLKTKLARLAASLKTANVA